MFPKQCVSTKACQMRHRRRFWTSGFAKGANSPGFSTSGFAKCEAVDAFGLLGSPNENLSRLLDFWARMVFHCLRSTLAFSRTPEGACCRSPFPMALTRRINGLGGAPYIRRRLALRRCHYGGVYPFTRGGCYSGCGGASSTHQPSAALSAPIEVSAGECALAFSVCHPFELIGASMLQHQALADCGPD